MDLYHLLNRGVEKRTIFMDSGDYARFVHDLYEFNGAKPALNAGRTYNAASNQMIDLRNQSFQREKIVDLHGWCLMKNHYHLLLSEIVDGGLTKFIRKLNVGYANYFNEKYKRQGTFFQGRTKRIRINSNAHHLHILNYIHLNPLDYLSGGQNWRRLEIEDRERARQYLEKYRWSSYNDYCGRKNFPSILSTEVFGERPEKFESKTLSYLKDIEMPEIRPYLLE